MICHCGRAARGFGWSDPVMFGPIIPACSMDCLAVICRSKGKVKSFFPSEVDAIRAAIRPHLADIQGFFDNKPSESDVLEYMQWAYGLICEVMAESYKRIVDDDIPY